MIESYKRHSPSALNLFSAEPAMFVLEKVLGVRQPVGAPAFRGTAVEEGVTEGLMNGAHLPACVDAAIRKYDAISALSGDKRREEFRETIPGMVKSALEELLPYGKPSHTQGFVEWKPDGLLLPIVGYYDFYWDQHGIVVDLKTSEKLPSAIKIGHSRQVALYAAAISDNIDARISYCTPKKRATYRLENVREHREALKKIAMTVERFLALSDDPSFFLGITSPDLESYFWGGPARQIAFERWGV